MASSPIPMANVLDIQPEDLKFDQDHKRDLDHRHKWASGAEEENKKSEAIRVRPIKPVLNAVSVALPSGICCQITLTFSTLQGKECRPKTTGLLPEISI